jgi:hypothetical protein
VRHLPVVRRAQSRSGRGAAIISEQKLTAKQLVNDIADQQVVAG